MRASGSVWCDAGIGQAGGSCSRRSVSALASAQEPIPLHRGLISRRIPPPHNKQTIKEQR
jgi:hypothetical protein